MGTWGYAPRDGDGPWDAEGRVHHEAIAPYLIELFKKPLRKGSRKLIKPEVMKAELEKAGIKLNRPKDRAKRIDRGTLKRYYKKRQALRTKLLRRKDASIFYEIQYASNDRWTRLGLVQILSEKRVGIPVSVVKKCRADLRELAKDEGYASIWDEPKLFKKAVKNMLDNVDLVLERDKIRQRAAKQRRAKSKRNWPRRRGPRLVHDAFFRDRPGEEVQGLPQAPADPPAQDAEAQAEGEEEEVSEQAQEGDRAGRDRGRHPVPGEAQAQEEGDGMNNEKQAVGHVGWAPNYGAPLGDGLMQSVIDRCKARADLCRKKIREDIEKILERDDRVELLVELVLRAYRK